MNNTFRALRTNRLSGNLPRDEELAKLGSMQSLNFEDNVSFVVSVWQTLLKLCFQMISGVLPKKLPAVLLALSEIDARASHG